MSSKITIRHHDHVHTGVDELQMVTACNDAYREQRQAEFRNANRSTTKARRIATNKSIRANRNAA